jgi:hypothetical protein
VVIAGRDGPAPRAAAPRDLGGLLTIAADPPRGSPEREFGRGRSSPCSILTAAWKFAKAKRKIAGLHELNEIEIFC